MNNPFQSLLHGKYVTFLEAELLRLRDENRALTNSLLGTAGFPPLDPPAATQPVPLPRLRKRSWFQQQTRNELQAQTHTMNHEP